MKTSYRFGNDLQTYHWPPPSPMFHQTDISSAAPRAGRALPELRVAAGSAAASAPCGAGTAQCAEPAATPGHLG